MFNAVITKKSTISNVTSLRDMYKLYQRTVIIGVRGL